MGLKDDLNLKRDFEDKNHEALLSLYFTSLIIKKKSSDFFKKYGITEVQFNVLELIFFQKENNPGLTQIELSKMMMVNRANITTLVDRMEKSGLVERCDFKGDRRYNMIAITDKGLKKFKEIEKNYIKEIDEIINVLDANEISQLIKICGKLRKKIV
jgi:DNA-binding MarR family transcriptional regulator